MSGLVMGLMPQIASAKYTLCAKGKYGIIEGGTSADMACKNCSVSSFAQADGSNRVLSVSRLIAMKAAKL